MITGFLYQTHLPGQTPDSTILDVGTRLDSQEVAMAASGRNWGDAVVDNETLQFSVGSKPLFSVALPDVTQVSAHGSALSQFCTVAQREQVEASAAGQRVQWTFVALRAGSTTASSRCRDSAASLVIAWSVRECAEGFHKQPGSTRRCSPATGAKMLAAAACSLVWMVNPAAVMSMDALCSSRRCIAQAAASVQHSDSAHIQTTAIVWLRSMRQHT